MQPFCCRADTKSPLSVSVIPVILTANYVTDDLKMAMFCISDSKLTRTDILVFAKTIATTYVVFFFQFDNDNADCC